MKKLITLFLFMALLVSCTKVEKDRFTTYDITITIDGYIHWYDLDDAFLEIKPLQWISLDTPDNQNLAGRFKSSFPADEVEILLRKVYDEKMRSHGRIYAKAQGKDIVIVIE